MVLVCAPARRTSGAAAMVAAAAAVNLRREIMLPPCWSCSLRASSIGVGSPRTCIGDIVSAVDADGTASNARGAWHVNRTAQSFPDGRQAAAAVTERSPPGGVWCATLTPLEA